MNKPVVYTFVVITSAISFVEYGWLGTVTVLGWLVAFKLTIWRKG